MQKLAIDHLHKRYWREKLGREVLLTSTINASTGRPSRMSVRCRRSSLMETAEMIKAMAATAMADFHQICTGSSAHARLRTRRDGSRGAAERDWYESV